MQLLLKIQIVLKTTELHTKISDYQTEKKKRNLEKMRL